MRLAEHAPVGKLVFAGDVSVTRTEAAAIPVTEFERLRDEYQLEVVEDPED
ncbi:MAG: hypothetical protein HC933_02225 [Pleurocapsa sp. SU_196_0]|nr:hypothetical protein [Pleurocapsa sp. SU_196_0]